MSDSSDDREVLNARIPDSFDCARLSVKDYLNEPDNVLVDLTIHSKDIKITGIRDYFTKKGYLSTKQRWCLCSLIVSDKNKEL